MDIDHSVDLATQVADQLIGVDRNEWKKWTEYLQRVGNLDRALSLAERLGQSPMLRPRPQHAYRKIGDVIKKHKPALAKLSMDQVHQVFGFIGWRLVARLGTPLEGRLRVGDVVKQAKGARQISGRKAKRGR